MSGLLFALSAAVCVICSLRFGTAPADARTRDLTFSQRDLAPEETPRAWYVDPRYQAAGVVALTLLTVIVFR